MDSSAMATARRLVAHALEDPQRVLHEADTALRESLASDHETRSLLLRALALAARTAIGADSSVEHAECSLSEARLAGSDELVVDSALTLAGSLALQGNNEGAVEVLGEAGSIARGVKAAQVRFQLGSVQARRGLSTEAHALYSEALPVLKEHNEDWFVAMTLHNRGMLSLYAGNIDEALDDFYSARDLEIQLGLEAPLAAVEHNIAAAIAASGDIPRALEMLDASESRYAEIAGSAAEVQVSRVETLIQAGLFVEARALALGIADELEGQGLHEDAAEAILAAGEAALASGEPEEAWRLAGRAAEHFGRQHRWVWESNARQLVLGALLEGGQCTQEHLQTAEHLADELDSQGQFDAAFNARLTAGLIARELDYPDRAIDLLTAVAEASSDVVHQKLKIQLAKALIADMSADRADALREARLGMAYLDEYQSALGAMDIRIGIERHARRLGGLGLGIALELEDPRLIFEWMELTKARSLRYRSLTPPRDSDWAADLAALRQVELALRTAGSDERSQLKARELELQEAIRSRSRHTSAAEKPWRGVDSVANPKDLLEGITLVELSEVEEGIVCLIGENGSLDSQLVGDLSAAKQDVESLRFSLRLLARGRGSPTRSRLLAEQLDHTLFGHLDLGAGRILLVPPASMYSVPWSLLPTFSERPFTVSPSVGVWARLGKSGQAAEARRNVLVAGPDLTHADREVAEIAAIYDSPEVFGSRQASVDSVLSAIDGAAMAHFAAHAVFQRENPMFTSLRLANGDLHVHDLEVLEQAPRVVMLSACDSGFSDARTGEELLGLTTALLSMGTRTVIASVGLVPDTEKTVELMTGIHRSLTMLGPARALHEAASRLSSDPDGVVAAANFICVGHA